jgi:Pyridine nucleotide-disulphide oxidoreductase, dimerisation domain
VIFDSKTGRLLGAHMVGAEVTELIQGYVVAMNLETAEEELMHTVFPHPTLSEAMHEAVPDAYGRARISERVASGERLHRFVIWYRAFARPLSGRNIAPQKVGGVASDTGRADPAFIKG